MPGEKAVTQSAWRSVLVTAILVGASTGCSYNVETRQVLTRPQPKTPPIVLGLSVLLLLVAGASSIYGLSGLVASRGTIALRPPAPPGTVDAKVASVAAPAGVAVLATVFSMLAVALAMVAESARSAGPDPSSAASSLMPVTLKFNTHCTITSTGFFRSSTACSTAPNPLGSAAAKADWVAVIFAVLAVGCCALCGWMRTRRRAAYLATAIVLPFMALGVLVSLVLSYVKYPRLEAHLVGIGYLPELLMGLTLVCGLVTFVFALIATTESSAPLRG